MAFRQSGNPFNHDIYLTAYGLEQQAGETPFLTFTYALLDEARL